VAQTGTVTVTAYDATTNYRLYVPDANGPFAAAAGVTDTTGTADALATAWEARTEGQFSDISAENTAAVITLTALTPGVPHTIVSGVSGGAGTIGAYAATVVNLSPNDLNDGVNWSNNAVPGADDVYFDNIDEDVFWNLAALTAVTITSVNLHGSYGGTIGLSKRRVDGDFTEYFTDYFTANMTTINVGQIPGSFGGDHCLLNTQAAQTTINLWATGSSADSDLPWLRWKGTHASNAVRIMDGSFGAAVYGGETATIATLTIEDGTVLCGSGTTLTGCTVVMTGGSLDTWSAVASSSGAVTLGNGATMTHRSGTLGGTVTVRSGGTLRIEAAAALTIATLVLESGASLDVSGSTGAITITTSTLRGGSSVFDPGARITHTNAASLPDGLNSVSYTRGGSVSIQFS
jgi:hypothetical protein